MGTADSLVQENRTNGKDAPQESTAVWEQLLRLAEEGDIRAIKLYYDMLEKKQRLSTASEGRGAADIEPMAAIRRAVFGDAAVDAAAVVVGALTVPTVIGQDAGDAEDEW